MSRIISAYFTSKLDPQRNVRVPENNMNYIYFWLLTSQALGLDVSLAHDGLSDDFCTDLEARGVALFHHEVTRWSTNDERFLAFEAILKEETCSKALITDCSDVLLRRNPFDFMSEQSSLYCGSDEPGTKKIRDNRWMIHKMLELNSVLPPEKRFVKQTWLARPLNSSSRSLFSRLYRRLHSKLLGLLFHHLGFRRHETVWDFRYVNAGVLGGDRNILLSFVTRVCDVIRSKPSELNLNMAVVNYVLWRDGDSYLTGQPFTSPYKTYDFTGDYYIMHK